MFEKFKLKVSEWVDWIDQRWWATLLAVSVPAIPLAVLTIAPYSEGLEKLLKDNPRFTLSMGVFGLVLVPGVQAAIIRSRPQQTGSSKRELLQLLECLKGIVGEKVKRFEAFMKNYPSATAAETFYEITQPDQQIASIVAAVFQYFEVIAQRTKEGIGIRVALARMGEKHIAEWESFFPSHKTPRSDPSALQCYTAGFSQAKAAKKMIVIEDIKKEASRRISKRRFEVTDSSRSDEEGSMILYPIKIAGDQVPFVLSVCASTPRFFRVDQYEVYRSILENFEQRIVLEFCLQEIKRREGFSKPMHNENHRSGPMRQALGGSEVDGSSASGNSAATGGRG